ncbi:MAG: SH3 domain-containing protein, partial [Coleofasciculus sp. S288]|nr:SH3 domain-containing protein [Coleofasciculus sp. S288]
QGNIQLAQGLVGQCRAAKQRTLVYPERSNSSPSLGTIAPNEQVTLADSGAAGWIAISSPIVGYVRASDLKACSGGTRPPSSGESQEGATVCRRVIAPPEGLAVRNTPVLSDRRIAGVYVGNTVRLVSPRETQKDSQGRTWVRISAPATGWISSGFPNGNLSPEFSCP